jgi:hypothetical protein
MDKPLEQKNIIISAVEALSWGLKVTDEKGLKYNVPMYKKDTQNKTVAYATLEAYPQNGLNLNKCFKFVTVPNSQGGQSRYVRIITEPVQDGQPTQYASPQMQQSKPVTIEKEEVDWDEINGKKRADIKWMNALNNACLLWANSKGGEFKSFGELADYIYKLEPIQTAQDVADMVGGKVVEDDISGDPTQEIDTSSIPF